MRIMSRMTSNTSFVTPGALFRPCPSHGSSPAAFLVVPPDAARACAVLTIFHRRRKHIIQPTVDEEGEVKPHRANVCECFHYDTQQVISLGK